MDNDNCVCRDALCSALLCLAGFGGAKFNDDGDLIKAEFIFAEERASLAGSLAKSRQLIFAARSRGGQSLSSTLETNQIDDDTRN